MIEELFNKIVASLPLMTPAQHRFLGERNAQMLRIKEDGAFLKDIVADNTGEREVMAQLPRAETIHVDCPRVKTIGDGHGWSEAPPLDKWQPPGLAIMDGIADHFAALDLAERKRRLGQ